MLWRDALTSSSLPSSSPSSDSSLSSKNFDLVSPASLEEEEEQEGPASPSALLHFSRPLELPGPPQSAGGRLAGRRPRERAAVSPRDGTYSTLWPMLGHACVNLLPASSFRQTFTAAHKPTQSPAHSHKNKAVTFFYNNKSISLKRI